jgi:hypothetical protein
MTDIAIDLFCFSSSMLAKVWPNLKRNILCEQKSFEGLTKNG